jgi:hypothetical protein
VPQVLEFVFVLVVKMHSLVTNGGFC